MPTPDPRRPRRDAPRFRFVFVVAYGRSGSTLLQKIIGGIEGYHVAGENDGALAGLLASYESALRARTEQGCRTRDDPGDPWYGAHLIDPERYARRLASVFVEEIVRPPPGTRVVGFKEIRYLDLGGDLGRHLDLMRAMFEPALLVLNRRNAADVAGSAWWADQPRDEVMARVARFDREAEAYAAAHPAGAVVVDYDAYGRDPDRLRPLFDLLGEPFDRAAVTRVLDVWLPH